MENATSGNRPQFFSVKQENHSLGVSYSVSKGVEKENETGNITYWGSFLTEYNVRNVRNEAVF